MLTPLSGPAAVLGQPAAAGVEVYFDAVNAKGGIAGKYPVELSEEDTLLQTDLTVQKYNKLEPQVAAFAQIVGTAQTLAVLPLMRGDDAIGIPASLDASWVREPNLLPIGAPYQIQAINAVSYYLDEAGSDSTICSMIQDDAFGEAGQAGIDYAADREQVKVATTQRFKMGDKDVTGQLQQLRSKGCDMVYMVATPGDAATIWGTAAKLGFGPRWIGTSATWVGAFVASPLRDYLEEHVWIAYEGGAWGDPEVPAMKGLLADVKQFKPAQKPDQYFAFGYAQGDLMATVLEKAVERGDLSRRGLMAASEALGTVSFDGLVGDYQYGPVERRDPPRASTIFEVDAKAPFGLAVLEHDVESDGAGAFTFEAASR